MDDDLRTELHRLRWRQNLVIALVVIPYLVGAAKFLLIGVFDPILLVGGALALLALGLLTHGYESPR